MRVNVRLVQQDWTNKKLSCRQDCSLGSKTDFDADNVQILITHAKRTRTGNIEKDAFFTFIRSEQCHLDTAYKIIAFLSCQEFEKQPIFSFN